MEKERFYSLCVGDDNSDQQLFDTEEKFNNLINDNRTHHDGWYIIVKAEHKKEIEKEYGLKLKPLKKVFVERMKSYEQIDTIIYETAERNPLLESFWCQHSFNENLEEKIYKSVLAEVYTLPDDEIIEYMVKGKYYSLMKQPVKKYMYEILLNKIKQEMRTA